MTRHAWLDPSPFVFERGPVGCLLIHGFTSAPLDVRPMGEYLADRGITVRGIRLPGHGTTVDDLIRTTWRDWVAEAERGLRDLQSRCPVVFVGGHSTGGLLTLYLGARHDVAGLIAMSAAIRTSNPFIPLASVARYFLRAIPKAAPEKHSHVDPETHRRYWSYEVYPVAAVDELAKLMRQVRPSVAKVRAPILIVQGDSDDTVPPASALELYDGVASTDKELLRVHSGHMVSLDAERERVWHRAFEFIGRHSPPIPPS